MGADQLSARAFFFGDSILGQAPRSPPSRDVPFNTSYWGPNPSWRRTVNTSTTVPPVKEFWPQVLAELRERVPGPTFHSLLEDTTGEIGGNTVTVTAPNSYVVDMLDRHLGDGIKQTCAQVAGGPVDVVYIDRQAQVFDFDTGEVLGPPPRLDELDDEGMAAWLSSIGDRHPQWTEGATRLTRVPYLGSGPVSIRAPLSGDMY